MNELIVRHVPDAASGPSEVTCSRCRHLMLEDHLDAAGAKELLARVQLAPEANAFSLWNCHVCQRSVLITWAAQSAS